MQKKHVIAWAARMTRNAPRFQTFPVTQDEEDKDLADVTSRMIDWRYRTARAQEKFRRATMLVAIMGNAFIKNTWDPNAGPLVSGMDGMGNEEKDMIQQDPELASAYGGSQESAPEGDVVIEVVPPYEVTLPIHNVAYVEDLPGILHSKIITLQELHDRYPDHPNLGKVRTGLDDFGEQLWFARQVDPNLYSAVSDSGDGESNSSTDGSGGGTDGRKLLIQHEYWGRATKKRPNGIRVVVAGGQIMEPADISELANPYYHGDLPLVHLKHSDDGICFWSTCDMDDAIPIQMQLNETLSLICEARNKTCKPMLKDRNSGVDWAKFTNKPGAVLKIKNPTGDVDFMETPSLPTYVTNTIEMCQFLMESIYSDHKPSQGVSKAGDSGVKTRWLQMADEARFAPYSEMYSEALTKVWMQHLALMVQYVQRPKIGYVMGEEGEQSFFNWDKLLSFGRGEYPVGDPNAERARVRTFMQKLDIEVQVVPGKSVATVREDMLGLLQAQVLNPIQDKQLILETMGYSYEAPSIMADDRREASRAQSENENFAMGNPPMMPLPHEGHMAHLRIHKRFTRTQRFAALQPLLQAEMLAHIEAHEREAIREPIRIQFLQQEVMMEEQRKRGIAPMAPPQEGGGQGAGQEEGKQNQENPNAGNGQQQQPAAG